MSSAIDLYVYAGLPNCAMVLKARVEGLRDLGMCANPFGSFLLLQVRFYRYQVSPYRRVRIQGRGLGYWSNV
jgi:hypothetical protein